MSGSAQQTYNSAKTLWKRWVIKEAYPLYVTIGLGCAACAYQLGRLTFSNPDAHIYKKHRMAGMPDERDLERGEKFYGHGLRKWLSGREIGIFPNKRFTKPRDNEEE